jgi:hypothetical protein
MAAQARLAACDGRLVMDDALAITVRSERGVVIVDLNRVTFVDLPRSLPEPAWKGAGQLRGNARSQGRGH